MGTRDFKFSCHIFLLQLPFEQVSSGVNLPPDVLPVNLSVFIQELSLIVVLNIDKLGNLLLFPCNLNVHNY